MPSLAHQPNAEARWRQAPDVVARRIRGEVLLVPIRQSSAKLDGFYTLNSTAAAIWELAVGQKTLTEIRSELSDRYQVTKDAAAADVSRILHELEQIGALQPKR